MVALKRLMAEYKGEQPESAHAKDSLTTFVLFFCL